MGEAWQVLLFAAMVAGSSALSIPRDDSEMMAEDEDLEFPFAAVDDSLAGVPGTGIVDEKHQIGFAHSTRFQEAQVDCDMQGESGSTTLGEDPSGFDEDGRIDEIHRFACYATSHWPEIEPDVVDPFNLIHALFEGNNHHSASNTTSSADFENSDCSCKCSGRNHACGLPGSVSFFSEVPNAQACAQMICHENKFSSCSWQSQMVSLGNWSTNSVLFTSNVLEPIGEPLDPAQDPTQLLPSLSPSMSPIPSPSPSASLSPAPSPAPVFRNLVVLRALSMVASIKERACLTIHPSVVDAVHRDLVAVNLTLPMAITCPPPQNISNMGSNVERIREGNGTMDNALAGYGSGSALLGDPTRLASEGMNLQSLVQFEYSDEVINTAAWRTVNRLFRDHTPENIQCGWDTPPLEKLLEMSLSLIACNSSRNSTTLRDSSHILLGSGVISTSPEFYLAVVEYLKSVHLARVEAAREAETIQQAEEANQQENNSTVNEDEPDMEPPFVPPVDPGPIDNDREYRGMEGGAILDCDDPPVDMIANDAQLQDVSGVKPGSRTRALTPAPGANVLPEFGRTKMSWPNREVEVITTITQPVPFYDAEDDPTL